MSELERRPAISLSNGRRIHYTAHDWDAVLSTSVSVNGSKWPVGNAMKHARDLQATALYDFEKAGKALVDIQGNKDLTDAAKQRMSKEALDQFAENVDKHRKALADSMQSIADSAKSHFQPVKALDKGDAVGVAMDAELRAIVRGMESKDRMLLINQAREGQHPELTAALLRAPALATGLTQQTLDGLRNAGIASAYGSEIMALRNLVVGVHDDVIRTTNHAAETLEGISKVNHPALSRLGKDTASDLRGWISELPMHRMQVEKEAA